METIENKTSYHFFRDLILEGLCSDEVLSEEQLEQDIKCMMKENPIMIDEDGYVDIIKTE